MRRKRLLLLCPLLSCIYIQIADYNKAIEIDPDDMDNLNDRALLYQNNLDDYEKACTSFVHASDSLFWADQRGTGVFIHINN